MAYVEFNIGGINKIYIDEARLGRVQIATATFTSTPAVDYVDLTWTVLYANFALLYGVNSRDSNVIGINLQNPTTASAAITNTGVRVVPTAYFNGVVWVANLEIT